LLSNKINIGAYKAKLAKKERDISKNFAQFAVALESDLRERPTTDVVMHLDKQLSAPERPEHR
jgi:hypothetical protein